MKIAFPLCKKLLYTERDKGKPNYQIEEYIILKFIVHRIFVFWSDNLNQ